MQILEELVAALAQRLLDRGETVSVAESCTGGMIASALTDLAGSSAWFGYGFVTYSNEAKQALLGVSVESLRRHGAVSEAVVREMAAGARAKSGAAWSLAVSGIAGPGGGTAEKPVGTVWVGLDSALQGTRAFVCHFDGDRRQVRQQTAATALKALLLDIDSASLVV